MIPIKLKISGFTSYRNPVEIDFTGFDLACISGPNGAGKSSLLDAITYALYGEARKRDEAIINTSSSKAEVQLDFEYESQIYRIVRSITRGKGSQLDFLILNPESGENGTWKVLTEQNISATKEKIVSTLRLDYDTFVNAAFFLQGKADLFATQRPADRKRILSSILGLDQWDEYHRFAKERIQEAKNDLEVSNRKLDEIQTELDQEVLIREKLQAAEQAEKAASAQLEVLTAQKQHQVALQGRLEAQRQAVDVLQVQLDNARNRMDNFERQKNERESRLQNHLTTLDRSEEINLAYAAYNQVLERLRQADEQAEKFRPIEGELQVLRHQLEIERQNLTTNIKHWHQEEERVRKTMADAKDLQQQLEDVEQVAAALRKEVSNAADPENLLMALDARKKNLLSQNGELKARMEELKSRIDRLKEFEEAICPFCSQPITADHRDELVAQLESTGTDLGDQHRANRRSIDEMTQEETALNQARRDLEKNKRELAQYDGEIAGLKQRLSGVAKEEQAWLVDGARRLKTAEASLGADDFLPEVRLRIAEEELRLAELGYDARAHQQLKEKEKESRPAVEDYNRLQAAHSAVEELKVGITDLDVNLQDTAVERDRLQVDYDAKLAVLLDLEKDMPDIEKIQADMSNAIVAHSNCQRQLGGIRQQLNSIEEQKSKKISLIKEVDEIRRTIRDLELIQKAFGKDGVPAMLIEEAIPELAEQANDILSRLSDGTMSVSFPTQRELKDPKRSDKRETLDIVISDGGSVRAYETFSGGEAFRINFAIRLALSRVLAKRAGARLQTLVIDEGFGNQDAQGRQRLIEAINLIRQDFRKILIITHIEELKDSFPDRIEVSKTPDGSRVEVLAA